MSTLSFVALSLQTTHLDPATVSKISYTKLVEGEVTRIGSIEVIPPTQHQQHDEHDIAEPTEALPWPEALKNFSMIVGKLPLVSYYRDADKEIFQAASKFYDDTPPNLHWLDGRAVVQHLEPEFQEYQLLSVLQTLNLHKQYSTSSTSEQTAQIILTLAQQHEIDSTKQLWGELYHQPDDHLELPFTVESGGVVTQPETDEIGVVDATTVPQELSEETQSVASPAVAEESTSDLPDADSVDEASTIKPGDPDAGDEGDDEELSAVVVASVPGTDQNQDQEQEQPEFLKVPLPEDLEPSPHDEVEVETGDDEADVPRESQPTTEEATEPQPEPVVAAEHPEHPIQADEESQNSAEDALSADEEVSDEEPVVEVDAVDAESSDVEPDPAEATVQQQPVLPETALQKTSSVVRVFALLGFIFFGLLTVAGVVVTAMAGFQFVVPNTLMLETKIAGVLLTGTLTLLSLLMTTVCYQKFRKK